MFACLVFHRACEWALQSPDPQQLGGADCLPLGDLFARLPANTIKSSHLYEARYYLLVTPISCISTLCLFQTEYCALCIVVVTHWNVYSGLAHSSKTRIRIPSYAVEWAHLTHLTAYIHETRIGCPQEHHYIFIWEPWIKCSVLR